MREADFKKFRKNKIFCERVEKQNISFFVYRLTYNDKRFIKKAHSLQKKLAVPSFVQGEELDPAICEGYALRLELNLFLELAAKKKIKTATITDPKGNLCFKIDNAVKNLATLKIRTENSEIYENYTDYLLRLFGTCPLILEENGLSGTSYHLKGAGKELCFGQSSFRADIGSAFCLEAEKLCPKGAEKEQFFTLAAHFCRFPPLLNALPQCLCLNDFTLDVNSIF